MRIRIILALYMALASISSAMADETPNERQARRIFDKAYDQVFGNVGSSLSYDVNIVGLYKTHGTIWIKGKRNKFVDDKVNSWNDGITAYKCYRKKRVVEIYHAASKKKDKYSGRFKFNADDFTYHVDTAPEGLLLTLKQKHGAKSSVKEVKALVERKTYAPKRIRIKVAFFWTTITVRDFNARELSDDIFIFPREKYKDWKFVDKR